MPLTMAGDIDFARPGIGRGRTAAECRSLRRHFLAPSQASRCGRAGLRLAMSRRRRKMRSGRIAAAAAALGGDRQGKAAAW